MTRPRSLAPCGFGRPERQVLQRQAKRLGVRELALEQVQARLQRRELAVGQHERRQEVRLALERVELLAGELVALRADRDAELQQLRAVRVEAARERLVGHVVVALDRVLRVARGHGPPFRHEVRDERELTDQLVAVMAQARVPPRRPSGKHTGRPRASSRRPGSLPPRWAGSSPTSTSTPSSPPSRCWSARSSPASRSWSAAAPTAAAWWPPRATRRGSSACARR